MEIKPKVEKILENGIMVDITPVMKALSHWVDIQLAKPDIDIEAFVPEELKRKEGEN
jgi:hypothetical protein